jgi:hypothetical protein
VQIYDAIVRARAIAHGSPFLLLGCATSIYIGGRITAVFGCELTVGDFVRKLLARR